MTTSASPTAAVPWWRGAVLYEIYPRSFMDSDGDGVGDLPGILSKLEYVASLGVDGLWICPFYPSPMKDFGYDVADYCDVDPRFGTLDDFRCLLQRAHELGLKVIVDQVWSHTSDQHPWFQASRQNRTNDKADWYVWADPKPNGMLGGSSIIYITFWRNNPTSIFTIRRCRRHCWRLVAFGLI